MTTGYKKIIIRLFHLLAFSLLISFTTEAQSVSSGSGNRPALIPLPQELNWNNMRFPLHSCKRITVNDPLLAKEGVLLQMALQKKSPGITVKGKAPVKENFIELRLGKVASPESGAEAYYLEITDKKIVLTANTSHGIFNGIQTLLQLTDNDGNIAGCRIIDWPAFSWRGYMVDVGRNFQSMALLKQQIDIIARYKLNIFHFHPTEDIAWRIAIRQYPQLTAAETMLRNKGNFYTEADIKELIAYCKERHITFVPEIDMPGHSAAFRRAMKTDMQSDTGLQIVKNILTEFCTTYDVPYIHIGADEVKITNLNFIPEVTAHIQRLGKKVIGWQPGGNFSENTIRQLWMDDLGKITGNANIRYIDSRHLYLNHMDPLESVVTLFNRKISNKTKGDSSALGGTICVWPDRNISKMEDALTQNPVYPSILAFAERSWRGGGIDGWVANIGTQGPAAVNEFAAFEKRLLDHKQKYFRNLPFPYYKQSSINWELYGPYDNNGDLSKKFDPELRGFRKKNSTPEMQATGGTIVLRHWWAPLISGQIRNPKENTTWYATTKIWAEEDGVKNFWIGFNNLSRSTATDPPPVGAWDNRQSEVWVNRKPVLPPVWKRGGMKGNPEIPLIDEGYEYREPTKIALKKGWNYVLIKAPVGSFKGKDWQNPVKWMFTFIEVADRE